jgi:hypothetical protein
MLDSASTLPTFLMSLRLGWQGLDWTLAGGTSLAGRGNSFFADQKWHRLSLSYQPFLAVLCVFCFHFTRSTHFFCRPLQNEYLGASALA